MTETTHFPPKQTITGLTLLYEISVSQPAHDFVLVAKHIPYLRGMNDHQQVASPTTPYTWLLLVR